MSWANALSAFGNKVEASMNNVSSDVENDLHNTDVSVIDGLQHYALINPTQSAPKLGCPPASPGWERFGRTAEGNLTQICCERAYFDTESQCTNAGGTILPNDARYHGQVICIRGNSQCMNL